MAVIGALNVDIGGHAAAAFAMADSIPGEVTATLGGVGWNIARDCALLGADTAFYSAIGQDEHLPAIRQEAAQYGIALDECKWMQAPNNRYLYICDQQGDMVAAVNDMRLCEALDAAYIRSVLPHINRRTVAVVDANLSEAALTALAEGLHIPLVTDCVSAVKCQRLLPILSKLHTLKANRMEAQALTGQADPQDALHALLESGVRRVIVSLGSDGFLIGEGNAILHQRAYAARMMDATGAGDCLTAALAVGAAAGLSLHDCAALGAQAAAVTVEHPGAVTDALRDII